MIDVTGVDVKVGDKVTIFGDKPHAKDIAQILGTIPYEVFTSVARRVKRVVVKK
jgi:alanine racemase